MKRSLEKEIIDLEKLDEAATRKTYRLITHVNRFLGGTHVILHHLEKFSRNWPPGATIRILDVASGPADIDEAILKWAKKKSLRVSITAFDLSYEVLSMARTTPLSLVQGKNLEFPFPDNSFDYVLSSLFFHHLSDEDIVASLRAFDRLAKRGVIINDLRRSRAAYFGISFLALFTGDAIFQNDAPLSVLRGFKRDEAESFVSRAALPYIKYSPHYAFRFALAGEKHDA